MLRADVVECKQVVRYGFKAICQSAWLWATGTVAGIAPNGALIWIEAESPSCRPSIFCPFIYPHFCLGGIELFYMRYSSKTYTCIRNKKSGCHLPRPLARSTSIDLPARKATEANRPSGESIHWSTLIRYQTTSSSVVHAFAAAGLLALPVLIAIKRAAALKREGITSGPQCPGRDVNTAPY